MSMSFQPSFSGVTPCHEWRGGGGYLWSSMQELPQEPTQPFVVFSPFGRKSWVWSSPELATPATTTFPADLGVE